MHHRSSSMGRNTSASVTVTAIHFDMQQNTFIVMYMWLLVIVNLKVKTACKLSEIFFWARRKLHFLITCLSVVQSFHILATFSVSVTYFPSSVCIIDACRGSVNRSSGSSSSISASSKVWYRSRLYYCNCSAVEFIVQLLVVDQQCRLSIIGACQHSWMYEVFVISLHSVLHFYLFFFHRFLSSCAFCCWLTTRVVKWNQFRFLYFSRN